MKKKIVVLALCLIMISGCGSKIPTLSNGDEAVVTLKDGSKISANDLYNEVKTNYALEALISMSDKTILEDKYSDKIDEAKEYADSTLAQLEDYYGDGLLEAIQYYTSYTTIEGYKASIYLSYLQNIAIEDYAKEKVTDKEIKKYYKDEVVGDIKVSHILITPDVKEDASDEEKSNAEQEAKDKVNEIINELKKAKDSKAKFEELAKEYSKDESTKENGGSLGFINKGTLGTSYQELEDAAFKLKDGEYSTSVITTEIGYHVIMRLETKDKAELDEVKDSIVETLSKEYIAKNPKVQVTALQELRKDYDFEIVDTELQKQYATYIQNSLAKYDTDSSQTAGN